MSIPYWRLSGFYFFYFATVGGFLPYWSLYLKNNGFNPVEIGQLSAILVATKIIAPNLWGWIADYTGKSLRIIRLASLLSALFFASFLLAHGYVWFASITVCFSFFWNAALPQFEAATLAHLKDEPHRYSQIRLWGSVGFIVSVLGIGQLLDNHPISLLPAVISAFLVAMWGVSLITPDAQRSFHQANAIGIKKILTRPDVLAFFAVYLLIQAAHAPYYVFYSIYLKTHHYSATLTGLLWALGVLAEIVLFIYAKYLLKRWSLRAVLLVSLLLSIIRWWIIARYVDSLPVLIIAQLLHAATFGGTHIAAIHLIDLYFGRQHQGKGQALYGSLSFGVGGMLGSLFSGYYWESLGSELVYSMAAICCSMALLIAYIGIGKTNNTVKLTVKKA